MVSTPAPTGPSVVEQARSRLQAAIHEVEQIRDERETAEGKAIGCLDDAHDLGIKNKGGLLRAIGSAVAGFAHKSLRVIGDLADRFADVFAIVAIALVAVVLVAGVFASGGSLAILAGPAAAWLFNAAAISTAVSVGAKATSKAVFDDADLSWGQLGRDGAFAAVGFVGVVGAGKIGKFGSKTFQGVRRFVPVGQKAAQAADDLAAVQRSGIAKRVFVHAKTFGKDKWQHAQPLVDRWKTVMGPGNDPTKVGFLWKSQSAGRRLWSEYADDPFRIVRPIEMGTDPAWGCGCGVRVEMRAA